MNLLQLVNSLLLKHVLISFIASALFAPIMIAILYRLNQVADHKKSDLGGGMGGSNDLFLRIMNVSGKNGVPNMGGIMIWLVVPIVWLLFARTSSPQSEVGIFILGFILFGFWGFLDVLFTNMIKKNPQLRTVQERFGIRLLRFSIAVALNFVIMYKLFTSGVVEEVGFLGFVIPFTFVGALITAVVGQLAIYAAEVTDGLDGIMIGMFGIVYTALGILLVVQGHYSFLPVIGIVIGAILVDLYFNIPPARFFNGGPGAMPLGLGAFYIALVTNNLIPYFLITGMSWLNLFSSMSQILSMRFFKKRIFKIAPLHHHFQALGWPEYKVTMRYWLATMVLSAIGLYIGTL